MGIQISRYITREEAEAMLFNKWTEVYEERIKREIKSYNDEDIEHLLETHFDKYSITFKENN